MTDLAQGHSIDGGSVAVHERAGLGYGASRERYSPQPSPTAEYRSVSPLPDRGNVYADRFVDRYVDPAAYRSSSVDARMGYRDGYHDRVVYRSSSADARANPLYGTSSFGGMSPYALGAEYGANSYASALGSSSNGAYSPSMGGMGNRISYGSAPVERYGPNYYSGPRGYNTGDTYLGGSMSYAPPPSTTISYGPPQSTLGRSYVLPQSGSFVAEPYAVGAPYMDELRLPQSSSFVAPLAGVGLGMPDYGFGALPPPAPTSFAYGGYGGYTPGLPFASMSPSLSEPRSNYYSNGRPQKEEFPERPNGVEGDRLQEISQERRAEERREQIADDQAAPSRRQKKRHGYGCC